MRCAFCQKEVAEARPGRGDVCPHCGRDLHCCFQCHFYDESAHHQCREPQADYGTEKDKSNFCDYFRFDPQIRVKTSDKEVLKAKWESFFQKK